VASVVRISEAYLLPVIPLLEGFPFVGGRRRYERNPGVGFRNRRERLSVTLVRALNWRRCCNPIIASKDSNEIASRAPPPLLELDTVVVGRVAIPVPLSATVCVPAPLPAFTLSVAVADPTEAGLNTTLMVQVAPTATEVPQVLVCENG